MAQFWKNFAFWSCFRQKLLFWPMNDLIHFISCLKWTLCTVITPIFLVYVSNTSCRREGCWETWYYSNSRKNLLLQLNLISSNYRWASITACREHDGILLNDSNESWLKQLNQIKNPSCSSNIANGFQSIVLMVIRSCSIRVLIMRTDPSWYWASKIIWT